MVEETRAEATERTLGWPEAYADFEREHGALVSSAGVFPGADRLLLRVEGRRAPEMIGGVVTNDVKTLAPRRAIYALLLTAKGRPVTDLRVIRLEAELWLDLPAAAGEGAVAHLGKYLPPRLARVERLEGIRRLSVVGPRAAEAVRAAAAAEVATDLEPLVLEELRLPAAEATARAVGRESAEGPGVDLYLPAAATEAALAALAEAARGVGGGRAGRRAHETWRIERGLPAFGPEIHDGVLPQETGLEARTISYTKGCYTGQEVVARIHYRGHVNRHLRGLRFPDGRGEPAPETTLYDGAKEVGRVTSGAVSPRLGPIALGYVRREIEPGSSLATAPSGAAEVRVEALPFTGR